MSNLATLQTAPPFTSETAKIYAPLAAKAREENRRARNQAVNPNDAQKRAMKQVDKVLRWMDKENDRDRYAQLTGMLDKVWNKAFPTQGAARPSRARSSMPDLPPPTPQENLQQIKEKPENPA